MWTIRVDQPRSRRAGREQADKTHVAVSAAARFVGRRKHTQYVLPATTRGGMTTNRNHQPQSWQIFRLIWAPWRVPVLRALVFPQRGDAAK